MTNRKLTAKFSNGKVLTRTTKTPTLSHAWFCQGANYSNKSGEWRAWEATGFASSYEKALKSANAQGWAPKRIDDVEVVVCSVA